MPEKVKLDIIDKSIAKVTLQDYESNNTFTPAFVKCLCEVFGEINNNRSLKNVVIHGYDNYFCCGGSRDELLKISTGEITFDQLNFYRLLLDCDIPVISAMQGHAIGGGLVFGSFGDILILAKESLYSANFMKYGFTPGMGATYIIPHRFGQYLGSEMLYMASNYHGHTLHKRGAPINVVEKKSVIDSALEMAYELTNKSRTALCLLKKNISAATLDKLPVYIQNELNMHEICFSDRSNIERNIKRLYEN